MIQISTILNFLFQGKALIDFLSSLLSLGLDSLIMKESFICWLSICPPDDACLLYIYLSESKI